MNPHCTATNRHHRTLQSDVCGWCTRCGYYVESHTCYDARDRDREEGRDDARARARARFVERIALMRDPTALAVLAAADCVAVHTIENVSFNLEFKTNSGKHGNMALEALPLMLHRSNAAALGTRTLYVYRDTVRNIEGCFWAHDALPFWKGKLPLDEFGNQKFPDIEEPLRRAFPGVAFEDSRPDGSGDPFVIVHESRLASVLTPDWRTVIANVTALAKIGKAVTL